MVRVASANLNYQYVRLQQKTESVLSTIRIDDKDVNVYPFVLDGKIRLPAQKYAMEVIKGASHSGTTKGIMASVTKRNSKNKSVVKSILESLSVDNEQDYNILTQVQRKLAKNLNFYPFFHFQ